MKIFYLNNQFWPLKIAFHLFACHWNKIFLISRRFRRIGPITQNEIPETLETINSLKTLIFFFKLAKSLFTYAKTVMLRLWISIRPTYNFSTNLQHNWYCFLLMKSLPRFIFLVLLKLQDFWLQFVSMKIAPQSFFVCQWN